MPEPTPADAPVARCPWCSAELPEGDVVRCPACHAQLRSDQDAKVPGLTEVLPVSVAKAQGQDSPKRNRLLSWISGEVDSGADAPEIPIEAVAPPPLDVRREMLRLQLEAEGILTADGVDDEAVEHTDGTETTAEATDGRPATDGQTPSAAATPEPAAGAPSNGSFAGTGDGVPVATAAPAAVPDEELQKAG